MSLKIGNSLKDNSEIIIPERGLYQNILITGTIGTGKTSSAMYPFLEQLLKQNLGMLILDVKGNFHKKVIELNKFYNRRVIVIELNGKYTYNPLDKPNLKASILANRLRTILTLFSNQHTTDTYWLDKVEIFLTECIKLCRLYNENYVTFIELHKLVNNLPYLQEKIQIIKKRFLSNELTQNEVYDFKTCLDFFQSEYETLDSKVLSIIQSEITRITQIFVSDLDVSNTFCPPKSKITFKGFSLNSNEIVVLNMNVAEYRNLAKIIATYLKLDFQSEVLMRLANHSTFSPLAFLCDEYHEYATENDADFYSQSREAKCISIVSTQSYTSLLKAIKDQNAAKVIIQNLVNKIWFRTDDNFTIEEAQKQLGKEDKTKFSRSISENAKETKYSFIMKTFKSDNSSLSESVTTQIYHDYIYDFNSFSRELKTFQAICFLSTGSEILPPQVVKLTPIHMFNPHKLI
ncbi:MAG: type IV secretion system DNA-binding domain-containing protein [Clostridia bacterium]|nr:type IV secretion system DNA-binding domain-containing protein [Clostridia bacterium]